MTAINQSPEDGGTGDAIGLAEILVTAASLTVAQVDHERFQAYVEAAMQLMGKGIASHLVSSDQPGLYMPLETYQGGKWVGGSILMLQDRAILAWSVGVLRVRRFEHVIAYDSVTNVDDVEVHPATSVAPEKVTLKIEGEQRILVRVMRLPGSLDLPIALQLTLLGAMKFDREPA